MKLQDTPRADDAELSRIRETLKAHAATSMERTGRSADGSILVTVDQRLQVLKVQILDDSISPERREALQCAAVEATNAAMREVVRAASEALTQLQTTIGSTALDSNAT
jgi:DNA-binding protein YbaB